MCPGNFWATDRYDSTTFTIWGKGCALTTLTILANFWANRVDDPMGFSNLDPRQMNLWTGMYAKGDPQNPQTLGNVEWDNWATFPHTSLVRVYRECSQTNPCNNTFPVLPSSSSPNPIQTLVNILRNGDRGVPVIIPIQCGNTTIKCTMPSPGSNEPVPEVHFVVVTGVVSQNGTFVNDLSTINVNDPGDVTTKTLADVGSTSRAYNKDGHITQASVQASLNNINNWKVYSNVNTSLVPKDPNTPRALGVYTSSPVEFVLTDPQGRRTGFDPVTNTLFQEIPTSAYSTAIYGDEQDLSTPAPLPFTSLDMANQIDGQYTLDVIGTGSGNFTVEITTSAAAGNWITQTYSGTTAPGVSSQITFQGAATIFAAFSANVAINNSKNQFAVGGQFTLGTGSSGIDPLTQPVTLQVGAFSITIPAGSFQLDSHGNYVFQGTINEVQLAAGIQLQGGNQYAYAFAGQNANSLPTSNPVNVRLAIGSNGGDTSVNANFLQ